VALRLPFIGKPSGSVAVGGPGTHPPQVSQGNRCLAGRQVKGQDSGGWPPGDAIGCSAPCAAPARVPGAGGGCSGTPLHASSSACQ
jgi:hypothetical protein